MESEKKGMNALLRAKRSYTSAFGNQQTAPVILYTILFKAYFVRKNGRLPMADSR